MVHAVRRPKGLELILTRPLAKTFAMYCEINQVLEFQDTEGQRILLSFSNNCDMFHLKKSSLFLSFFAGVVLQYAKLIGNIKFNQLSNIL